MSTGLHDYTKDDTPYGSESNPEDFIITGSATAVLNKTADEIEKENSFVDMPPGEHLCVIAGFSGAPEQKYVKVKLNDQLTSFATHSIMVRLALADNPKCSITDFFLLPPSNDAELKAYFEGVPDGKKAAGWAASKFIHFINRIGFLWAPGQPFPEAARKLGNWKGRHVILTVDPGRGTYKDKDGVEKPSRPSVRSFSYRPAGPGQAPPAGASSAVSSAAQNGGQSLPRPALAGTATGLDDI